MYGHQVAEGGGWDELENWVDIYIYIHIHFIFVIHLLLLKCKPHEGRNFILLLAIFPSI